MYVAHHARLDAPSKEGTLRAHLEESARKGSVQARATLKAPEFPDAVEYLHTWLFELHGRSGVEMGGGLAPLSYSTIAAWSRLTDQHPEPQEVSALLRLDAVLRHPVQDNQTDEPAESAEPKVMPAWPTAKTLPQ